MLTLSPIPRWISEIRSGPSPAAVPPPSKEKVYEEPFVSSDEESDAHNGTSCSRDYGPLIVLSSDDELLDYNTSDGDDDEGDSLNQVKSKAVESSSDELSTEERRKSSSEGETRDKTAKKTENGAAGAKVRRKTLPSIPQVPSTPGSSKEKERKKSEGKKTDKNQTKVSVETWFSSRSRKLHIPSISNRILWYCFGVAARGI